MSNLLIIGPQAATVEYDVDDYDNVNIVSTGDDAEIIFEAAAAMTHAVHSGEPLHIKFADEYGDFADDLEFLDERREMLVDNGADIEFA